MSNHNHIELRKLIKEELQEIFKKEVVQEKKRKKHRKKHNKLQYPSGRFFYPVFGGFGLYGGGGAVDSVGDGGGDSGGGDGGGGMEEMSLKKIIRAELFRLSENELPLLPNITKKENPAKKIKEKLEGIGLKQGDKKTQGDWFKNPSKDYFGTPQPGQYGFWISSLKNRYGNVDLGEHLDAELEKNGIHSINMWVGSHVHGWIHRKLELKETNLNESRLTTYSSKILHDISKNVPGLKGIASNTMVDGSEGLYRYSDGNAYEIQVRPVEYANDKDNWKRLTSKKQKARNIKDNITQEEIRKILWLAFKETVDKIEFAGETEQYYKYKIAINDTFDVDNAINIGKMLSDKELGKYTVDTTESVPGFVVMKYLKGSGIKKVFDHLLAGV